MTLFRMLKHDAKRALRGNWGKAIGSFVIVFLFFTLLSVLQQYSLDLIAGLSSGARGGFPGGLPFSEASLPESIVLAAFLLITVFLGAPLLFGVHSWFYDLTQGEARSLSHIFTFFESFSRYIRSVWLYISLFVRTTLWGFAFTALPLAMTILSSRIISGRSSFFTTNPRAVSTIGTTGMVLSVILTALAVLCYIIFMQRYSLSMYLFLEDPSRRISAILKDSIAYSRGYRLNMTLFSLSFIGWFLLCILFFPLLYTMPYYSTSLALYSRYLIRRGRLDTVEPTQEFVVRELSGEDGDGDAELPAPEDFNAAAPEDSGPATVPPELPPADFSKADDGGGPGDAEPPGPLPAPPDNPSAAPLQAEQNFHTFPRNTAWGPPREAPEEKNFEESNDQ